MRTVARRCRIRDMQHRNSSRLEAERLRGRSSQIERVVATLRDRAADRRRVTGMAPPAKARRNVRPTGGLR